MKPRQVTQAEFASHCGVVGSTALVSTIPPTPAPRPLSKVYQFDFVTVAFATLNTPEGRWQREAKQQNGWELLSAAPQGDHVLLTWRKPR